MAKPTSGADSSRKTPKSGLRLKRKSGRPKGSKPMGKPFTKNDPRINRKGRPPSGTAYKDLIRAAAETVDVDTREGKISRRQAVVDTLFKKAIEDRDLAAINRIIEASDDRPTGDEILGGGTVVQVFAYLRTIIFRATADSPEVRERIIKQIEAAIPPEEQQE